MMAVRGIAFRGKTCAQRGILAASPRRHGRNLMNTPTLDLTALRAAIASFEDSLDVVGDEA